MVTELDATDRWHVMRLGVVVDIPGKDAIETALEKAFGPRITHHSVYSATFDCQVIEVFAPGVNKWTGIVRMCRGLDINPDQVVTIGDGVNDIAMLCDASLSFAMGNADHGVREAAKHVTASQSDCGVARVIDGILKGKWE